MAYSRVDISERACAVIDRLRAEHGPLLFHQSGGCCDGSSPMCFSVDDFKVGTNDILLGSIHGCAFYISKDQFEYWQHTHLTVDVIACRGSSFSLEIPLGLHFVVLSRLYSEAESADLDPVQTATSQSSS